jgi:hypothetical protein
MAEPSAEANDATPWVSLSEAAERTGRHIDALRSLGRRKRLPAKKGNAGQWLVQLPIELLARPDKVGDLGTGLVGDEVVAGLMAEVTELREALARAEAEAQTARDTSGSRVAAVRAEVDAKDALIAELKTMLAEARRPWWRRFVGR